MVLQHVSGSDRLWVGIDPMWGEGGRHNETTHRDWGIGGGLLAPLAGCGVIGAERYRFRMTVEVDTPNGVRTGSSVYEVKAWNPPKLLPEERSRDWSVRGEAVAVDLPGGRTLFALLKTVNPMRDDLTRMSMAALDPAFRNDVVERARRIVLGRGIRSPAEVEPSDYPLLVTFRNLADPRSLERIAPKDLPVSFGPGVALKRIVVEKTSAAITTEIKTRITWIEHLDRYQRDPHNPFTSTLPNDVGNLRKGI